MSMTQDALASRPVDRGLADIRLMLRVAQMYYGLHLTQEQIGKRLGISRFKVGRLLDRALRESAVRIEIVHPAARLVELEDHHAALGVEHLWPIRGDAQHGSELFVADGTKVHRALRGRSLAPKIRAPHNSPRGASRPALRS